MAGGTRQATDGGERTDQGWFWGSLALGFDDIELDFDDSADNIRG